MAGTSMRKKADAGPAMSVQRTKIADHAMQTMPAASAR